jgi:secondary thiamine-phosphate synthase enzyme
LVSLGLLRVGRNSDLRTGSGRGLRALRREAAGCHQYRADDRQEPKVQFHPFPSLLLESVCAQEKPFSGYHPRMKFHTEYLTFHTANHREYINVTPQVEAALRKSGIREGMILVSAMHITAAVYVNDAEDGLIADIDEWLEQIAPYRKDYRHHQTGETNGDSHLKSLLIHHEVIVPVTAGKLDFGPWQQIYYAEFDGRRSKRVIIKVMGE